MSKNKKYCPVCGAELDIDAIICTTCGEHILGDAQAKEINETQNAKEFNTIEPQEKNKNTLWNNIEKYVYILGAIVILLKICVYYTVHDSHLFGNILPSFNFIANPKCDSTNTKELAKQIFVENSPLYKTINPETISNIDVLHAVPISYDEKIKRYTCNATIHMESQSQGGFAPEYRNISESNFFESYLALIAEPNFYDGWIKLNGYDTMNLTIKYSSQISDNNHIVYLENTPVGNPFSCENKSGCESNAINFLTLAQLINFMPYDGVQFEDYETDYDN